MEDKEQEYQELCIGGWCNGIEPDYAKTERQLKFFHKNKIKVSFRYKNKQEYFFVGEINKIPIYNPQTGPTPQEYENFGGNFTMKLSSGDLCVFNFDDIDYLSIHPASYNPIRYFERKNISEELRDEVFKRDNNKCQLRLDGCTEVAEEVDHIIPVSKGGLNSIENLQASCRYCNRKKSNKLF